MLTQVPNELIAGDTWAWTRTLSGYPAPTWSLTYFFVKEGKTFSVVASASGADHAVSVAPATTAPYPSGRYQWTARATDGTTVTTVESGWVDVKPNPATSTVDPRSWAAKTLEAINAFLLGNATTAQSSMAINGRSISRWPLAELRAFQKELRTEVRKEELGAEAGRDRRMKVRFTSA